MLSFARKTVMLDRKEIEKRLAKVPEDFVVAFAGRAAMRVFPILSNNKGKNEVFGFWGESRGCKVFCVTV